MQRLHYQRLRIAPHWWSTLAHPKGTNLRRCRGTDAAFVAACYANADFAQRYNRQAPWTGDLAKALDKAGRQPPLDSGLLQWIVCDGETPIGLASLSSISATNRKAEYSIGFAEHTRLAAQTMGRAQLLLLHFAYFVAGFNKLYAYIYADNRAALDNGIHLGFREEGILRDHYYLPPGRYFDVHAIGLTRAQLLASPFTLKLARRWLGVDWLALATGPAKT